MIRRVVSSRPRSHVAASGGPPGQGGPGGPGLAIARAPSVSGSGDEPRLLPRVEPLPPPPAGQSSWSTDDAYGYCERIARSHYENFPVASRFVPPALRRHVWAIYAYARTADDFADEPRYASRRKAALDEWEEHLERAFYGEAEHPIFVALRDTVERRDIPILPLRDLLTSFRMDLTTGRYPTFEALLTYAQYSAAPVGQLLLYVFDYRDPSLHRYADDIATALELTHFLQDLPTDLAVRDRLYIPGEDLVHFGVSEEELRAGHMTPGIRDLMRYEVARARALFERGRPLTARVGRDLGFELSLIWQGGMCVLDLIEAHGFDVFHRPLRLGHTDKLIMLGKAAALRWPVSLGRLFR